MDLEYFKKQICEEIDGAKDYAKKAIEIKAMNQQWGGMFLEMSKAELGHASNLYKMATDYYQKAFEGTYSEIPEYIVQAYAMIVDKYTSIPEIEMLHDLYKGGPR